jgi:hypothetical protein
MGRFEPPIPRQSRTRTARRIVRRIFDNGSKDYYANSYFRSIAKEDSTAHQSRLRSVLDIISPRRQIPDRTTIMSKVEAVNTLVNGAQKVNKQVGLLKIPFRRRSREKRSLLFSLKV